MPGCMLRCEVACRQVCHLSHRRHLPTQRKGRRTSSWRHPNLQQRNKMGDGAQRVQRQRHNHGKCQFQQTVPSLTEADGHVKSTLRLLKGSVCGRSDAQLGGGAWFAFCRSPEPAATPADVGVAVRVGPPRGASTFLHCFQVSLKLRIRSLTSLHTA